MKSVQIRNYFWSVFSRIQTEYGEKRRETKYLSLFSPNTGKCLPRKTPYLDIFDAMHVISSQEYMLQLLNLNKAGLFESSFYWGGVNLIPYSYFKKKIANISITLSNCRTTYLELVESKKNDDIICYMLTSLVSL